MAKTIEETYKKKNLHEHILARPGMYVGAIQQVTEEQYILTNNCIQKKIISYTPGLYKIFDEILVNSVDHSIKDTSVKNIKVSITPDEVSVYNDGNGIPVVIHKEYGIYIPELIFGNLLTSSSYTEEKRITGGLNGLGAKLCAVFSTKFTVETIDSNEKLHYIQTFKDNMYVKEKPVIKKTTKKSYTKITFNPDFSKFGIKEFSTDFIELLYRRVYDITGVTDKRVNVYLNDERLQVKDFLGYTKLYNNCNENVFYEKIEIDEFIWEIVVKYNEKHEQVSFVNGIYTSQGGKHIEHVTNIITKKLADIIKTKKKIADIKQNYIKDKMFVFLRATIQNPEFSSQTKEYLTTNYKSFGVKIDILDSFINKIYSKSEIVQEVISYTKFKTEKSISKTDGKKNVKLRIENLEDAHFAGTKKSSECSLILTEGLSAKTFAISGLSIIGRNHYGVFPLRGKLLNTREATQSQLMSNQEIINLKQILGLQHKKKYFSVSELRYGSIIILTDQDLDGSHITHLIINFLHTSWPELLEIKGFIKRMKTPIVKLSKGISSKEFYTLQDYYNWKQDNNYSLWNCKYYKGLGTSTPTEAKELFKRMKENIINYISSSEGDTNKALLLAFDKKQTDNRKSWLQEYNYNLIQDQTTSDISYQDSVNKELIHFSIYDVIRSIPSISDGLKPSQRKVLHTMFSKKYKKDIKVAQLGASVAEFTGYHHGEVSLFSTIINMAQDYTGTNNINLLLPLGQFGSRYVSGGKDSASPRYIYTKLADITHTLFNSTDLNIIDYLEEEGQSIEPRYFIPIIPMILVNGARGIGTGYSTNIPCYNPKDIMNNMIRLSKGKPQKKMIPWYKSFKGNIKEDSQNFICYGKMSIIDNKVIVTELPIDTYVDTYIDFLNKCMETKEFDIVDYINNSTDDNIEITIVFGIKPELNERLYKDLKLSKKINTTNFHLFDKNGVIKKYSSAEDILKEFYELRLEYNQKRKDYLIKKYNQELDVLSNKIRFLEEIMSETLVIYKKSKKEIQHTLTERNYTKIDNNYSYLLDLPMYSFTKEELDNYTKKYKIKKELLNNTKNTTIIQMMYDNLQEINEYL